MGGVVSGEEEEAASEEQALRARGAGKAQRGRCDGCGRVQRHASVHPAVTQTLHHVRVHPTTDETAPARRAWVSRGLVVFSAPTVEQRRPLSVSSSGGGHSNA